MGAITHVDTYPNGARQVEVTIDGDDSVSSRERFLQQDGSWGSWIEYGPAKGEKK